MKILEFKEGLYLPKILRPDHSEIISFETRLAEFEKTNDYSTFKMLLNSFPAVKGLSDWNLLPTYQFMKPTPAEETIKKLEEKGIAYKNYLKWLEAVNLKFFASEDDEPWEQLESESEEEVL